MDNHDEKETTEPLPQSSHEARYTGIETTLADQQTMLKEINSKLDLLIKMQHDMYVDLRGRFTLLEGELRQIKQDIQPDSFQNRLMRMGQ